MAEYLTNNLHLFQKLSYRKMRHFLVPYGVLTDEEQSQIDRRNHDEKYQMTDVITNIVNHLYYNRTSQLKGFLRLLEEDGDPDFKKIAITLGWWISILHYTHIVVCVYFSLYESDDKIRMYVT